MYVCVCVCVCVCAHAPQSSLRSVASRLLHATASSKLAGKLHVQMLVVTWWTGPTTGTRISGRGATIRTPSYMVSESLSV